MDGVPIIFDKNKKQYSVEVVETEIGWVIKVKDGQVVAARADMRMEGKALFLDDIVVCDNASHPIGWVKRLISNFGTSVSGREENYRNRGLGSNLLKFIISHAQNHGFEQINGTLCSADLIKTPHLIDWYKSHNFQINMNPDGKTGTIEYRFTNAQNGREFSLQLYL